MIGSWFLLCDIKNVFFELDILVPFDLQKERSISERLGNDCHLRLAKLVVITLNKNNNFNALAR